MFVDAFDQAGASVLSTTFAADARFFGTWFILSLNLAQNGADVDWDVDIIPLPLGVVFGTNATFVNPALGTPASGVATNLTGTAASLTSGITNALKSATTTVDVSASAAPSVGKVLMATDSTHATWQTGGTVSVVGAGSLTSTALVTGGGSQTVQTPIPARRRPRWIPAAISPLQAA